jgi:hypothetical protein
MELQMIHKLTRYWPEAFALLIPVATFLFLVVTTAEV